MNKQKRQAIGQMVIAAIMGATVIIPGMIAVHAATVKEQAEQAEIKAQEQQAVTDKIEAIKAVVVEQEQPEQVQKHWDIPLDAQLQKYIVEQSTAHGIQPEIIVAMIKQESNYKADTMGDKGNSFGLMQIQKRFHLERMERLGVTDLLDPYSNVSVGIDFLAELLDKYDGNIPMALTAYNCGASGAYNNYFSKGIYANNYAKRVMETWQSLQSQ